MPTISVDKVSFLESLGKRYTTAEFDEVCFEYGLELDEDTEQTLPDEKPYKLKIEVPANRYDLLCFEGLSRALRIFLGIAERPKYTCLPWDSRTCRTLRVSRECAAIRPFAAGAILRGVTFTQARYDSFIDLQDKLHGNLARKRTLVAIGTHDLAHIAEGDIDYQALPPQQIKFAPLNKQEAMTAPDMMTLFETDRHLSRYLHIIKDSPVYPVFFDSKRTVLSMPPIINSNATKITLQTRDIFIDLSATDETKLEVVTNVMATMFSEYCERPFVVEPVKVVYPDGREVITPNFAPTTFDVSSRYINSCTGLALKRDELTKLLERMGSEVRPATSAAAPDDLITVDVPPSRPDILQQCDLMEEVAIAYGFNNIKKTFPPTNTVAVPLPVNKLADIVRRECAYSGWVEMLPLILCSHDENFGHLNRTDDGKTAIVLENPKTVEYQIVRTSLLPGLLKSLRENKQHTLPMRLFEVSDVAFKDASQERKARNRRKAAALYCGHRAAFEIAQGLLDRLMLILGVKPSADANGGASYHLKPSQDATYFPGRSAEIIYRAPTSTGQLSHLMDASSTSEETEAAAAKQQVKPATHRGDDGPLGSLRDALTSALPVGHSKDIVVGTIGILHPSVLQKYSIDYPCTSFELDLECFLGYIPSAAIVYVRRRAVTTMAEEKKTYWRRVNVMSDLI
ncbi:uncharacterized protein L969DRAFT_94804 [Mixia osmundae IAM 14324]|uniref:phenylalanine--tRNA ligase n=1 Tax=Mixia osmundae (strain CBS 9802 / IAM 14324 / JCM 22182 / KY 12970) TaxID=764103 RepID=G7E4A6_MIXOS|nr:uncharacterized protein L969DRAFT_94804 [Mixia osmundae IAM 14324]KEI39763.1 hypothetical protein L969DRAFT_94804 [Mixia osmundae IAM 14324]GAA97666.1 hypothetical protein E5Q_04344 [Mixia osmundae IAM 14324]